MKDLLDKHPNAAVEARSRDIEAFMLASFRRIRPYRDLRIADIEDFELVEDRSDPAKIVMYIREREPPVQRRML